MIRLGAVDDHPVVLHGIGAGLAAVAPDIQLVGTASSVQGLLTRGARFDVVLLDLRLDDASTPAENTALLRSCGAHVLVYTEGGRPALAFAAVRAGALGVLSKWESLDTLAEAVRRVSIGDTVVSARLARALSAAPRLADLLSAQEREVLRLYAADVPAKSIARRLGVAEGTVKEYLKRIRAKLATASVRATTKLELRDVAEVMGLVGEDPPQLRVC